ncbi:UV damage endonuclease UvsE [Methanocella sp. CWC-04]|uniref:UV damage endonuclease UvsE n=1 Tax=Methanooceanicella nereidis TaxID=2052831 RepID=A0AAP2R9J0_9EURY|nr:UV damage endonuclease UvsE [Methanocella sp. CWC-04]MCD1293404.1 UV damage endonuclease UvsE [Methanocella sp. CWC-04]
MRIGYAAIPYEKKLLPVTSKKSASITIERLAKVAGYTHELGIDLYRIPANISPHENIESIEKAKDDIKCLGELFRRLDIRTCFHVTYYCIMNSPNPKVIENSINELNCMYLYDKYAGGGNHIELHAGGAYGDRQSSIRRFIDNVLKLEEPIFKMIRLENEEHEGKIGTIEELFLINRETGIPLIFDVAHYRVNPLERKKPVREIVKAFLDTWAEATTFPMLHYSTTPPGSGTHLPVDPVDFWEYVDGLKGLSFDIMLETKEKERDVLKVKAYKTR